jgi:hypothetical protein
MRLQHTASYSAGLDRTSIIITCVIALLFGALLFFNISKLPEATDQPAALVGLIISSLAMLIVFAGSYLYHISAYQLSETELIICRPIADKIIDLNLLVRVESVQNAQMKHTIRTFGNGGLFGYFGKFTNDHFGGMTWYVTQRKNYVAVHLQDKRVIILSPDDLALVQALKQRIKNH